MQGMSDIQPVGAQPLTRVADPDRDAVLDLLKAHCSAGALTLDEFSDRAGSAVEARTRGDLDRLTQDLPELSTPTSNRTDASTRRVVAICGSNRRRARWTLGRRLSGIAVAGTSWIDLRNERLEHGGEVMVRAIALFGSVKIFVPKGIGVELTGLSVFGAKTDRATAGQEVPGGPVIRIKGLPIFGSVRVMTEPPDEDPWAEAFRSSLRPSAPNAETEP